MTWGELLRYIGGAFFASLAVGVLADSAVAGLIAAIVVVVCFYVVDKYLHRPE